MLKSIADLTEAAIASAATDPSLSWCYRTPEPEKTSRSFAFAFRQTQRECLNIYQTTVRPSYGKNVLVCVRILTDTDGPETYVQLVK